MSSGVTPQLRPPIRKLLGVQVVGTGSYLPDQVVTNADLAQLGCDADWIEQRTGIRERRHAPSDIATSDMATIAGERAIEAAGVKPEDIDLLLLGTLSPDHAMPATAAMVQDRLGLNCGAVDLGAACAGFIYSLITGAQFVGTGCSRNALIIGADTNSRVTNPADKRSYPLFGDGAGAVVLSPGKESQGLRAFTLGSDGSGADFLYRPVGGARRPFTDAPTDREDSFMKMDGRPVFKWAVRLVADSSLRVLEAAECAPEDVDLWVFHQANERILDAAVESMGIDPDKVVSHLARYGNTSSGSIPIALDESVREGRIKSGSQVLICGFGGGLSWGTSLFSW